MNKNTDYDFKNKKYNKAFKIIEKYYIYDKRPFCLSFSGGKDSTAILYLTCSVLLSLKNKNFSLNKKIYIINSNTLAELPPLLEYLENTLSKIKKFAQIHNLPIEVIEVLPEEKDTLNVQLLGVGLPPPSSSFRWCTDKLKINPIDKKIKEIFHDGCFVSIIGTRRDESFDRQERIKKSTIKGTDLKLNQRYSNANNLMPIEHWSTRDVWQYLFDQKMSLVDIDFLWKLYSDASNKNANECSFVGAGGKNIDEGKIGCGVSRFGCWQCYMVRDNDKSLDGLMKSNYKNIDLYKEYRDWYWNITQLGWEKVRDVYNHRTQKKDFYNKGDTQGPKYGMVMPKGIKLNIRKIAFKKFLNLQDKLKVKIITQDEIILIQKRWLIEGDIELSAIKNSLKYNIDFEEAKMQDIITIANKAKKLYKENFKKENLLTHFSYLTLKRFAVQNIVNSHSVKNKFFPSKKEEKDIRREWCENKRQAKQNIYISIFDIL